MSVRPLRFHAALLSLLALFFLFQPGPAAQAQGSRGVLWEVATDDNTVYLLGSMHVLTPDCYPLAERLEEAYRRSTTVAFETELDALQSPAVQLKLMQSAVLPEGNSLRDELAEETFRLFSHHLAASGLELANFERLRPWMSAITLFAFEFQRLGFAPEYGADLYFYKKAKQDAKRIVALEAVDSQIELLAGLGKEDQDELLRQTLTQITLTRDVITELARGWREGDAGLLQELTRSSFADYPDIYEKIVLRRNRNWLPAVEGLLAGKEDALVVVGAAHLVGEEGLPELLRAKGYRVAPQ